MIESTCYVMALRVTEVTPFVLFASCSNQLSKPQGTNAFKEGNLQDKTSKKNPQLRSFPFTEVNKHLTYLGLVAYSCLVWAHSCPWADPGSLSSDSALACSVMMALSDYSHPWTHGYLKACSWNCLSY